MHLATRPGVPMIRSSLREVFLCWMLLRSPLVMVQDANLAECDSCLATEATCSASSRLGSSTTALDGPARPRRAPWPRAPSAWPPPCAVFAQLRGLNMPKFCQCLSEPRTGRRGAPGWPGCSSAGCL
ncbi:hypothetical protein GQ600_18083 [Phytophthora cactorum]|nr:hypothetical protein GQ600_18083 [Phytophthora cactorum]